MMRLPLKAFEYPPPNPAETLLFLNTDLEVHFLKVQQFSIQSDIDCPIWSLFFTLIVL